MKGDWFLGSKKGQQKKTSYVKIVWLVSEVRLNYYPVQDIIALKQKLNYFRFWGSQLFTRTPYFTNYVL